MEPSNAERDLKGYQYMDTSLRSVATQLLNVSSVEEQLNVKDNTMLDKVESRLGLVIRKPENPIGEIQLNRGYFNDNVKNTMVPIGVVDVEFDRSTNSKYNYFKTSHPGEAMAMTEEDLERELALSKLMTTHKKKPTTTGGISTWILLNPPSTTVKPSTLESAKEPANKKRENEKKTTLSIVKPTLSTVNIDTDYKATVSTTVHKISPTRIAPTKGVNAVKQNHTMLKLEKLTTQTDSHTTPRLETTQNNFYSTSKSTTPRNDNEDLTTLKTTTKRIVPSNRTRTAITTPKTTTVISQTTTIKVVRPSNFNQSTKSNVIRKVTSKPETTKNSMNVTSKVEKVTFRPVHMITTPKNVIQQSMPMFITKLQASLHTNSVSNGPSISTASIDSVPIKEDTSKIDVMFTKRVQTTPKQKPSKPNNVLNVQLKKPIETQTRIEIQPIKVNTPVLTIEKVVESQKNIEIDADKPIRKGDSKIDVKFVFNPELTKIVETSAENSIVMDSTSTSSTTTTTNTTKRPKQKRKKNKIRRRRPSSSTTSNPITTSPIATLNTDTNNIDANLPVVDSGESSLQESKIVPESDASTNNTKNKKKEVDKPISSQIYSFLSREVMPSFGVMSLVGLGLGLASYFLYPFGGTIARRNYEVQPNYQYNLDEYGGNYGQSEEEVFSKVLQGMTTSDGKYGGMKDYENNYYRYQAYDGTYTDPSYPKRRGDIRYPTSSMPIYRPNNTPQPYNSKYRKNELQYPHMATTPRHHERHAESEFMNNKANDDRQFVVGNIPKGYSYEHESPPKLPTTTESTQTDFEKQIAQSLKFVENPVNIPPTFEQPEAQALKANEGYEEIEIAPTAVAVEHGPRSLKLERLEDSVQDTSQDENIVKMRRKRESFIQQIPTRSETEKLEDEEDLSNEILDIIDSAIDESPGRVQTNKEKDVPQSGGVKKPIIVPIKQLPGINSTDDDGVDMASTITISSTITEAASPMMDQSTVTTLDSSQLSTVNSSPSSSTNFIVEARESEGTIIFDASKTPSEIITTSTSTTTAATTTATIPTNTTTNAPTPGRFNIVQFIKKIAEIKFRVGLTVLKHASESFAKYLGNFQKKLNGEE